MDIPSDITAKQMYDELMALMKGKERCYVLLDEVQEVPGWEKAVNGLLEGGHADIYVTGSNSKLMSSEISTYLTGRYVLIPVYPLSFREYLVFKGDRPYPKKNYFKNTFASAGFLSWLWEITKLLPPIKSWMGFIIR